MPFLKLKENLVLVSIPTVVECEATAIQQVLQISLDLDLNQVVYESY